jgi:hypothetical protein
VLVPEARLELAQGCPRGILSQNPQVSLSPQDKPTYVIYCIFALLISSDFSRFSIFWEAIPTQIPTQILRQDVLIYGDKGDTATPALPCQFSLFFVPVNIQANFNVFVTWSGDISLGAGDDPGLTAFTQAKILIQFNLDYQLLTFKSHDHILSHLPGLQVSFPVDYPIFWEISPRV